MELNHSQLENSPPQSPDNPAQSSQNPQQSDDLHQFSGPSEHRRQHRASLSLSNLQGEKTCWVSFAAKTSPPSEDRSQTMPSQVQVKVQVQSSAEKPKSMTSPVPRRRMCMCAPTTHPGSFRCSLHRNGASSASSSRSSFQLSARRSAMANSLVRSGGVKGEWAKRAIMALIRPSSHQLRRNGEFQPQPSRLRNMKRAEDAF